MSMPDAKNTRVAVTRPAATDLLVRIRADGRVLLTLTGARGRVLCSAEVVAEETEQVAGILASWALSTGAAGGCWDPELRQGDDAEFPRPYGPGLVISQRHGLRWSSSGLTPGAADERLFETMFGPVHPTDQVALEMFCRRFAEELRRRCRSARSMAEQRIAGGAYLPVLDAYVEQLRALASDQRGYHRIPEALHRIMHDEEYLLVAEDRRARDLAEELREVRAVLYGQCQDLDRGGIVGLRPLPERRRRGWRFSGPSITRGGAERH